MSKTVLIHPILWSHYKAKVFSELQKLCKKRDLEFLVLQTALTENSRKELGDPDVSLHKYPYKLLYEGSFEETTIWGRYSKSIAELKRFKPNVVILPGYYDGAVWGLTLYAKIKGIKIIQCVDSTYHDAPRNKFKEALKSFILKRSDLVFCYGKAQEAYLQRLSIPSNKIHRRKQATDNKKITHIYNNPDVKRPVGVPTKYFLFVGRLSSEKNVLTLLRAYARLESDWGLVIVGDGQERSILLNEVEQSGIHNVTFTGGMSWKEVVSFYKYASAFVLPSISEPWGLVVNEAMICSLPVLVSKHCGCSLDLVEEGVNGFLFAPQDVNELSLLLHKISVLPTIQLQLMGQHSKRIIAAYTPESSAQDMVLGIEKLNS